MKDGSIFRLYYMGGLLAITALIPMSFFLGEKLIAMARNLLRKNGCEWAKQSLFRVVGRLQNTSGVLELTSDYPRKDDELASPASYEDVQEKNIERGRDLYRLFDRLSRWLQRKYREAAGPPSKGPKPGFYENPSRKVRWI